MLPLFQYLGTVDNQRFGLGRSIGGLASRDQAVEDVVAAGIIRHENQFQLSVLDPVIDADTRSGVTGRVFLSQQQFVGIAVEGFGIAHDQGVFETRTGAVKDVDSPPKVFYKPYGIAKRNDVFLDAVFVVGRFAFISPGAVAAAGKSQSNKGDQQEKGRQGQRAGLQEFVHENLDFSGDVMGGKVLLPAAIRSGINA